MARGRQLLDRRWPGYSQYLTDEQLAAIGRVTRGQLPCLAPSGVFQGIDPAIDGILMRVGRDKDVTLGLTLARLPASEQREFLDLYLVDSADAQHWARLPRWKRPIRKGDKTDQAIWKFFIMQRLNMESHAAGHVFSLKAQGYQLMQMAGCVRYIADNARFSLFLSIFGDMLHRGEDLGDVQHAPWNKLSKESTAL
jgi:hypothetical protein